MENGEEATMEEVDENGKLTEGERKKRRVLWVYSVDRLMHSVERSQ